MNKEADLKLGLENFIDSKNAWGVLLRFPEGRSAIIYPMDEKYRKGIEFYLQRKGNLRGNFFFAKRSPGIGIKSYGFDK